MMIEKIMKNKIFSVVALILLPSLIEAAPQEIIIENNPAPFHQPAGYLYYEAQDLNLPSVRKMGEKSRKILQEAGNPTDELKKVGALSNYVAETLRHSHFDRRIKRRTPDPKFDTFRHDPVKILAYVETFMPFDPKTWPNPWCTHQNDVLIGLLNGIGLHGRIHNITGHVGAEYFSIQYRKWVYIDSTFNEYYVRKGHPDMPLSTLEMIQLTKAGRQDELLSVKFGTYPSQSYISAFPKGFDVAFMPKMWMATFDQNEAKNTKPNLVNFGGPLSDYQKPYPKAATIEAVDFPLSLIRIGGAALRGDGWVLVTLQNCIPHFSHYQFRNSDHEPWKNIKGSDDAYNGNLIKERFYRGLDNAGNPSEILKIELK